MAVTDFMMLFGVNFNFYYLLLMKQFKKGFLMEEVRWYFIIIIAAIISIWINIKDMYQSSFECLTDAAFQVG